MQIGVQSFASRKPPVFETKEAERTHVLQRLAATCRIFGRRGYSEGLLGHIPTPTWCSDRRSDARWPIAPREAACAPAAAPIDSARPGSARPPSAWPACGFA